MLAEAGYRVIVPYLRGLRHDAVPVRPRRCATASSRCWPWTRSPCWTRSESGCGGRRIRLGRPDRGHPGGAVARALPGARLGQRLPDRQPRSQPQPAAAGGRARVVVPVLLRDRARSSRLREVHARLRPAHLAAPRRRTGTSTTPRSSAAPARSTTRTTSTSSSTTTGGGSASPTASTTYDELERRLARAPADHRSRHHPRGRRERRVPSGCRVLSRALRRPLRASGRHRRHRPQPAAGGAARVRRRGARRRAAWNDPPNRHHRRTRCPMTKSPGPIRSIVHRLAGEHPALPDEGRLALVRRRRRLAQLGAADSRVAAGSGRSRRLLDLHLHQLAADAALRARLGGRSTRMPGSPSSACTLPSSASSTTWTTSTKQSANLGVHVSGRRRQRLRGVERLRQPLLAGRLPRGRRGTHPLPPLRRGRVRPDRDGDPAAPGRGRGERLRRRPGDGRAAGARGGRRLADAADRPRPTSATARARVLRRRTARCSTSRTTTTRAAELPLNNWDLSGDWTVRRDAAAARTRPAHGSRSSSTRATSTSSWVRRWPAPRSRSGCYLDGEAVTDALGTDVDAEGRGVLSRSEHLPTDPAAAHRSANAASRSSSSRRAPRATASRSDDPPMKGN